MEVNNLPNVDEIDIDDLYDENNDEEVRELRVPKRYLRDAHNPFEYYNEVEFKRRYRFSKDVVQHGLLPKVEVGLAKVNNRGLPIPPVMQLLIGLRFYATASFQVSRKTIDPYMSPVVKFVSVDVITHCFNINVLVLSSLLSRTQ